MTGAAAAALGAATLPTGALAADIGGLPGLLTAFGGGSGDGEGDEGGLPRKYRTTTTALITALRAGLEPRGPRVGDPRKFPPLRLAIHEPQLSVNPSGRGARCFPIWFPIPCNTDAGKWAHVSASSHRIRRRPNIPTDPPRTPRSGPHPNPNHSNLPPRPAAPGPRRRRRGPARRTCGRRAPRPSPSSASSSTPAGSSTAPTAAASSPSPLLNRSHRSGLDRITFGAPGRLFLPTGHRPEGTDGNGFTSRGLVSTHLQVSRFPPSFRRTPPPHGEKARRAPGRTAAVSHPSFAAVKGALRLLGQFYTQSGARARLPPEDRPGADPSGWGGEGGGVATTGVAWTHRTNQWGMGGTSPAGHRPDLYLLGIA